MGPVEAITTCFKKALTFSGRASRAEFWWFSPVGVALPILGATACAFLGDHPMLILLFLAIVLLLAVPLYAAGSRRLHDIGANGGIFIFPVSLVTALAAGWVITLKGYAPVFGAIFLNPDLGPGATLVIYLILSVILGILPGLALIFSPQMIFRLTLASQPGPNTYGPNPHEVIS